MREKIDGASGKLRKEMEDESHLCLGTGVFIDDCGLVHMSCQVFRNWSEQGQGLGIHRKSFIPWSQGVWASRCLEPVV